MKVTTIRLSQIETIRDVPEMPPIRTAKEWRRYQVMVKRMAAAIDESIKRALYGERYGCNPEPTTYRPDRGPTSFIDPMLMS